LKLHAGTWYVDNLATGSRTGASWANAWPNFASIKWGTGGVTAGDTLYISGGLISKTYKETLTVGASGTAGNVITISTGQDLGHNGQVIIDGGSYARSYGIRIASKSFIKITGKVGTSQNMRVTGFADGGVVFDGNMNNLEIAYLESDHNGNTSDRHGIDGVLQLQANYASSIHNCHIHDNYQDAIHIVQNNNGAATQFGSFLIYSNLLDNYNDDGMELAIGADIYDNEIGPRIASGGRGHPDGIQFYNSYVKIYNNYFHGAVITSDPGNTNSNIFCDSLIDMSAVPSHIQIFNNLIVENATPGNGEVHRAIAMKFAEPGIAGANDILILNNTIVGVPFFGLSLTFGSLGTGAISNIVIENNIFKDVGATNPVAYTLERGNGTITYGSHGSGADVTVDYNNVYASSAKYTTSVQWGDSSYTFANYKTVSKSDTNGFVGNPMLSSLFGLLTGSPAIHAGVSQSAIFSIDKTGSTRTGAWDIGAFSSSATSTTHPPSNATISVVTY